MQNRFFQISTELKQACLRGILIGCLATTMAVSFSFLQEAQPVSAAPEAVTSRSDRRPDRERSVATSNNASGFSQNSSTTSSHARPRLIRR